MVRDWSKIFTMCVHNEIGNRDCMLAELVWVCNYLSILF